MYRIGETVLQGRIEDAVNIGNGQRQYLIDGQWRHERTVYPKLRSFEHYKNICSKGELTLKNKVDLEFLVKVGTYPENFTAEVLQVFYYFIDEGGMKFKDPWLLQNAKVRLENHD